MLSHSQTSTTQRYAHLYDDKLREAAEQLAAILDRILNPAEVPSARLASSLVVEIRW
jgi:hypothetical protein